MANYEFNPDYVVPPGTSLKDILEERGMSQSDLALRTELTEKTVSQIISGSAPISYETAARLEMVLDVPASFWNSREAQYRAALLSKHEHLRLSTMVDWLKIIPVKELVDRGFVEETSDKGEFVKRLLRFFGVASIDSWNDVWLSPQVQFRGSKAQNRYPGYAAAWIRIGEIAAEKIECEPYDAKKLRAISGDIRAFTNFKNAQHAIKKAEEMCAKAGVAFVIVREIPKASVSGATRWITKDKAILMLSLKYKTDDQFWFSFFHELCHILKHGKKTVFLDDGMDEDSKEEKEANLFAREILIPSYYNRRLPHLKSKKEIKRFASEVGVSPGIVVGRLQRDNFLPPNFCNDLKVKYAWA